MSLKTEDLFVHEVRRGPKARGIPVARRLHAAWPEAKQEHQRCTLLSIEQVSRPPGSLLAAAHRTPWLLPRACLDVRTDRLSDRPHRWPVVPTHHLTAHLCRDSTSGDCRSHLRAPVTRLRNSLAHLASASSTSSPASLHCLVPHSPSGSKPSLPAGSFED